MGPEKVWNFFKIMAVFHRPVKKLQQKTFLYKKRSQTDIDVANRDCTITPPCISQWWADGVFKFVASVGLILASPFVPGLEKVWKKPEILSLKICVNPAKLNVTIFLGTLNVINVELCLMVIFIEFYLFLPLVLTFSDQTSATVTSNFCESESFVTCTYYVLTWQNWNFLWLLNMLTWLHL